jgi:hypothetical protein
MTFLELKQQLKAFRKFKRPGTGWLYFTDQGHLKGGPAEWYSLTLQDINADDWAFEDPKVYISKKDFDLMWDKSTSNNQKKEQVKETLINEMFCNPEE